MENEELLSRVASHAALPTTTNAGAFGREEFLT